MKILILIPLLLMSLSATADENGKPVITPAKCTSKFTSIGHVCKLLEAFGGKCVVTADACQNISQEVFAGTSIDLSGSNDQRSWNGMGGLGNQYSAAAVCLMRSLADRPQRRVETVAPATMVFGDVSAEQRVGFLSFDHKTGIYEGYHSLRACAPAVGCLDAYTQRFKLTPVRMNQQGSGNQAGQMAITSSFGTDVWAEGLDQGVQSAFPGISIPTPIGDVVATPQFHFRRTTGFVLAPYASGMRSSFADPALGISKNATFDIYGRNPGVNATVQLLPHDQGVMSPKGWISQAALGSRDANPQSKVWVPEQGQYPKRPDLNLSAARSAVEKTPNATMGASIRVAYSPLGLIPEPLRRIGCSGIVKLCFDQLEVFAEPKITNTFSSQLSFFQNEQSKWNGEERDMGLSRPVPDLRPPNLDQVRQIQVLAASSVASRFALEAGLDFVIRLEINTVFSKIKKILVNVHPRTTIKEVVKKGHSAQAKATARSQASLQLANKKVFQSYVPFSGKDLSAGTADGGQLDIRSCFGRETPAGSMPAEPTYTPGDVSVLVEQIEYLCNICVAWDEVPFKDDRGRDQVFPGHVQSMNPASQDHLPASSRWKCRYEVQNGCHDMCKMDDQGRLYVTRTAVDMLASGEAQGMSPSCGRGR